MPEVKIAYKELNDLRLIHADLFPNTKKMLCSEEDAVQFFLDFRDTLNWTAALFTLLSKETRLKFEIRQQHSQALAVHARNILVLQEKYLVENSKSINITAYITETTRSEKHMHWFLSNAFAEAYWYQETNKC